MSDATFISKSGPAGSDTVSSDAIVDGQVKREDLNTGTAGSAVVAKIVAGTNVTITETGVDTGTGDVTVNASGGGTGSTFHEDKTSDATITGTIDGANKSFTLSNTPAASSLILLVNALPQESVTHYSLSGAVVTLSDAPLTGDSLTAYYAT